MHDLQTIIARNARKPEPAMTDYLAVGIAEGFEVPRDDQEYLAAWQHIIDNGMAWVLPGCIGRQAKALIAQGLCHD